MKLGKVVKSSFVAATIIGSGAVLATDYTTYGNTTYGSDGSTYTTYGNTTYGTKGTSSTTCTTYGSTTYCN